MARKPETDDRRKEAENRTQQIINRMVEQGRQIHEEAPPRERRPERREDRESER